MRYVIGLVLILFTGCSLQVRVPGTESDAVTNGCAAAAPIDVVAVYPLNGANWMDYVKNYGSGTNVYNRDDLACAGTEKGYFQCVNGGEKKKAIISGFSSCSGISASDALGAFDWICDDSSGTATLYSRGLKQGKGLKDLVTATGFIPNSLTASRAGCPIAKSSAGAWWSNPVGAPPSNPNATDAPVALSTAAKIYVIDHDTSTSGYDISGVDRVAFVTLGDAVLSYSGYANEWCDEATGGIDVQPHGTGTGSSSVLCSGNADYLWIEGRFSGEASPSTEVVAGFMLNTDFLRVNQAEFFGAMDAAGGTGLSIERSESALVSDSTFYDNLNAGFGPWGWNDSIVMGSRAFNNGDYGFTMGSGQVEEHNVYFQNVAFNNGSGVYFSGSPNENFIVQFTTANTSAAASTAGFIVAGGPSRNTWLASSIIGTEGPGVSININSNNNSFGNLVLLNNSTNGLEINRTSNANQFTDLVAAHNDGYGVRIGEGTGADNSAFYGGLWVGNNASGDCQIDLGTGNLLDNSCQHGTGLATAPVSGVDASASFIGKLAVNDGTNSTPQVTATALFDDITDWIHFENPFRGWGLAGAGGTLSATQQGACASGDTCQIYDWRLASSDALLLNHYGAWVDGSACPASVDASVAANVLTDQMTSPHTYLLAAVEIMDPSLNPNGNFNGLCESNEACIFTPNLGAYQGSGDFMTRSCAFTGGNGVTGVTMHAYPQNGA